MRKQRWTRREALALGARAATLGALAPLAWSTATEAAASRQATTVSGEQVLYFAETGHNVQRAFLSTFQTAGGEVAFGLPLSEERYVENQGIVQTFEGISLVYDPTLEEPWDLQGQHLPNDIKTGFAPAAARKTISGPSSDAASVRYFPESKHEISGNFAEFWNAGGGLAIYGLPLSEAYTDSKTKLRTQVFERAIFEESATNEIHLFPIARQLVEDNGALTSDPAFLPAPPNGGETRLVQSPEGLRLRSAGNTDAGIIALLADNAEFVMAPGSTGKWLPGYADGYSGWVSSEFLSEPKPLPTIAEADWDLNVWQGAALSETNVRSEPSTKAPITKVLAYADPVKVTAWVEGEEVYEGADLWAQIGPKEFIYGRNVGRNAPVMPTPIPPGAPTSGKWIDVNLTQQLMVAYDGKTVVRTSLVTTGMAGWETPTGSFSVINRVANETMDSGAIGAESFYKLEDVLFTQYFTNQGHAIHFAWWRTPETIGRPGSHGCLNLLLDDSQFYWDWADYGVPLIVHY
jgi:hypothetical protein